jgi:hypothetical protein
MLGYQMVSAKISLRLHPPQKADIWEFNYIFGKWTRVFLGGSKAKLSSSAAMPPVFGRGGIASVDSGAR